MAAIFSICLERMNSCPVHSLPMLLMIDAKAVCGTADEAKQAAAVNSQLSKRNTFINIDTEPYR